MAEIIRIPRRPASRPVSRGRLSPVRVSPSPEVHYDYADGDTAEREAERLWNDSDPTVPGIIKVPPEATPPPMASRVSAKLDTAVDVMSAGTARRPGGRWQVLALAAVATAAAVGLCEWAFAQRRIAQSPVPAPVIAPPPMIITALPSPVMARPETSARAVAPAHPSPEVSGLPSGDRRRTNAGETRHRPPRHVKEAAPADALETVDFDLAGRGKRARLRAIDTSDPFAP